MAAGEEIKSPGTGESRVLASPCWLGGALTVPSLPPRRKGGQRRMRPGSVHLPELSKSGACPSASVLSPLSLLWLTPEQPCQGNWGF